MGKAKLPAKRHLLSIMIILFIIGFLGIPTLPLPLAGQPEAGRARPGRASPGLPRNPNKPKGLRLEAGGRLRPWCLEAVSGSRASHSLPTILFYLSFPSSFLFLQCRCGEIIDFARVYKVSFKYIFARALDFVDTGARAVAAKAGSNQTVIQRGGDFKTRIH